MTLAARTQAHHERLDLPFGEFEFRDSDSTTWTFEGVACTVDHPYQVRDWLGEYTETVATGAFDRSLEDPALKVSMHSNHQHGRQHPLATRHAGTLELRANPNLEVVAHLDPARPDVQILRSVLKRGEVHEMSIGFHDVKGGSAWNDDYSERTLTDLRLREVSVVEDGANDLTVASIRSLTNEFSRLARGELDEAEIRQAIEWFESFLPDPPADTDPVADAAERSGLVVTDDMIRLWEHRLTV
jgi:HK97 family phage prohead protease